jgi:glycosyltransferase involved in cell wall biosynthesis
VFVDNGSTDSSIAIAEGYRDRMQLQIVDASERKNQAGAKNAGAEVARSDKLVFVDADDEVLPGYLIAMSEALEEHPIVAPGRDLEALNPDWVRKAHDTSEASHGTFMPFAFGSGMGLSRRALLRAGGWPEEYPVCEDMVLSYRLQRQGLAPFPLEETLLRIRFRTSVRALFRQTRAWGYWEARVHREFGPEFAPRRTIAVVLSESVGVLRQAITARNRTDVASVAVRAGYSVGRFLGSLRWRVFYP